MASDLAQRRAPLSEIVRNGANQLGISPSRIPYFQSLIEEAIEAAKIRIAEPVSPSKPTVDQKRVDRELRAIIKAADYLLTRSMNISRATQEALEEYYAINDQDLPDYRRAAGYLRSVPIHALEGLRAPRQRGRKKLALVGRPNSHPLDEFVFEVLRALYRCEARWLPNKNDSASPQVLFFQNLAPFVPGAKKSEFYAGRLDRVAWQLKTELIKSK